MKKKFVITLLMGLMASCSLGSTGTYAAEAVSPRDFCIEGVSGKNTYKVNTITGCKSGGYGMRIYVRGNVNKTGWEVECDADWVGLTSKKPLFISKTSKRFYFRPYLKKNDTGQKRYATITITQINPDDDTEKYTTLSIVQNG